MQINQGGLLYPFCPGKATWDHEVRAVFNLLMFTAETGQLYRSGGLINQPEWYLDLLGMFLPLYNKINFASKVKMVLGDGKAPKIPASRRRK